MDQTQQTIAKFRQVLPTIREWIETLLTEHAGIEIPAGHRQHLDKYFPNDLLDEVRVVVVQRPPVPPISRLGIPELAGFETMRLAGITYMNKYFVAESESHSTRLHFHELVHVAQWKRLGMDRFLLAYGVGLVQSGYENSPLERMAKQFEQSYRNHKAIPDLVVQINQRTDEIWSQVEPLLGQ